MVAVGDSLTAGMQDATLDLELQNKSFSSLIAGQAGLDFQMPEIHGGARSRRFLGHALQIAALVP